MSFMRNTMLSLVIVWFAASTVWAQPTAPTPGQAAKVLGLSPAVPSGLGANIHFTDPRPGETEMLAGAGLTWVRMDFHWGGTERKRGEYDFSAYDRLLASLDKHHMRAVLILDYGNGLYDNDAPQTPRRGGHVLPPSTDEGRAAMARWAAAAVTHFKGRGAVWEMWNEPNIGQFWPPKPDVQAYVKLALAVGKAIRQVAPDELYIGPATSTMDFTFLEECFKGGLLEYWQAVSVHPYRQSPPETVEGDYARLRDMIRQYAPKGKCVPIISGEWGYSSAWGKFDPDKQGLYLPRQWLTNLANQVPVSIWYDWHDDGTNPKEGEHHFGMVAHEYLKDQNPVYAPKPAYLAARSLIGALEGFAFAARLEAGGPENHVLRFEKGPRFRLAAWTTASGPREVTIKVPPGEYRLSSYTGADGGTVQAGAEGLRLTLTGAPIYARPR